MTKSEDIDCLSSIFVSIFDIQRAQQIERHFEHLIEKPFESIFKFIHVLPGSFSAYNMDALRPVGHKDELLKEYFRTMDDKLATNKVVPSTFSAGQIISRVMLPKTMWRCCNDIDPDSEEQVLYNENVYLAEDRILCLGIHKNDKDIVFMPDVYAQVEPIKMINDLMGEKKREINGGAYSFEKVR
jgi:cellulose synthase/poly-beta-1,6-N-acetylglucosamine synthase-like glycosyltransferase